MCRLLGYGDDRSQQAETLRKCLECLLYPLSGESLKGSAPQVDDQAVSHLAEYIEGQQVLSGPQVRVPPVKRARFACMCMSMLLGLPFIAERSKLSLLKVRRRCPGRRWGCNQLYRQRTCMAGEIMISSLPSIA